MDEGAALEMLCRGNSTEGSNPSLSAILFLDVISPQENPFDRFIFTSPTL